MFMKFEILSGAVTVGGSVSGERGDWTIRVAPSDAASKVVEDQTAASSWHELFDELVAEALAHARRQRMALASGAR
jgi:hypothetical protein